MEVSGEDIGNRRPLLHTRAHTHHGTTPPPFSLDIMVGLCCREGGEEAVGLIHKFWEACLLDIAIS